MSPAPGASWAADLAAKLGLPTGDFYLRGYDLLPGFVISSVAVAAAAYGLWRLIGGSLDGFRRWAGRRCATGADVGYLILFCTVLIAAFDGKGIAHGFFRGDDFSFVEIARAPGGLARQLLLYHNDHLYTLFRAEVWGVVAMAGNSVDAHALAAWFNALNFGVCLALLMSACWLLHELGGSRFAVFGLAFLTWTWPGWGEFTCGYYTLSAYVQVQALGFCAAASMIRAMDQKSTGWLSASLGLAVLATGVNISGVSVFGALFLFVALWRYKEANPRRLPYLASVAATFVGVYVLTLMVRHPYSARELVQNPAGTPAGAGMVGQVIGHPIGAVLTTVASAGGLLLNFVVPTFLQLGVGKLAAHPGLRAAALVLEMAVGALAFWYAAPRLMRMEASRHWGVLAAAGSAGICLVMVIVGRTPYALATPPTLWFAKYMIMPICWGCVAIALLVDRHAHYAGRVRPGASFGAFVVAFVGTWLVVSVGAWEKALLPSPLAYASRGRWGNAENAVQRARSFDATLADLETVALEEDSRSLRLPEPSVWGGDFFREHPDLEWGSDYTPGGVGYLFWDILSVSPNLNLHGSSAPRESFPPDLKLRIEKIVWLRRAFDPPPAPIEKIYMQPDRP